MAKKKDAGLSAEERLEQALVAESEQPYKIPDNWIWVKFGELGVDIADGPFGSNLKREHYTDNREVRIIQLSNIGEEGWKDDNTKYTSFEHLKNIARSEVKPNEIVIAKMMPAGRAIIVPNNELAYVLSSDAIKFVPHKDLVIKYMVYAINNNDFRNQITSETQGITRARTSIKKLKSYAFPLPPYREQKRIVDRLENLFEKLDQSKLLLQEALDSFENRKAAILHKAFTGELTKKWREENGISLESWISYKLKDVCIRTITDGTHQTPTYSDKENGVPFISAKDVTTGKINFDNIKYITKELHEELYKRIAPQRNDVLLAKNGTTGVAALVETDMVFDIYVTLALLRPNIELILPRYLLEIVNSPISKRQFDEHLTGIGVPNLHLRDIREVEILVPNLNEQEHIISIIEETIVNEEQSKEILIQLLEEVDLMKKSILARAFRGELGTNDPTDENAIELLKRVLESD